MGTLATCVITDGNRDIVIIAIGQPILILSTEPDHHVNHSTHRSTLVILNHRCHPKFRFYLGKHNGRVINLQPNLGNVELTAYYMHNQPIASPPTVAPDQAPESSFSQGGYPTSQLFGDVGISYNAGGLSAAAQQPFRKFILQVSALMIVS